MERKPDNYKPSIAYAPREYQVEWMQAGDPPVEPHVSRQAPDGHRCSFETAHARKLQRAWFHQMSLVRKPVPVNFHALFPAAKTARRVGTFTDWKERGLSFRRLRDGNGFLRVLLLPGHYEYAFEIDGNLALDPKAAGAAPHPGFKKVCLVSVS